MIAQAALFLVLVVSAAGQLDSRWKLVWNDEFTGTSLDTTKWSPRNKFYYGNPGMNYDVEQVSVSNGTLILTSQWSSPADNMINTGYVDTTGKAYWTYGRFEVFAKLPFGRGLWPAHWLLSEIRCWPYGAEFDIMENLGQVMNVVYGTYHYGATCGQNLANGSTIDVGVDLSLDYHTYAIEWTKENITWFLDNQSYHVVSSDSLHFGGPWGMDDTPHYFILNTYVGGWPGPPNDTTIFPQYHYIDYVRVYAWEPCETGCGEHGTCNTETELCECDDFWFGTYCEYALEVTYSTSFQNVTELDLLTGNAVIQNDMLSLTLNATGCPKSCVYTGGIWQTISGFADGNFTFVAKSTNVPGTGLVLSATGGDMSYQGFQLTLSGANPNMLSFQGFVPDWFANFKLPFDASQDFHTYTIEFQRNTTFVVYVDGEKFVSTGVATPCFIIPHITLQESVYFGTLNYTGPVYAYAQSASFNSAGL